MRYISAILSSEKFILRSIRTDIQELVEAIEESFYPIPFVFVNLYGLSQVGNGFVPSLNRVLQENDLFSDFSLLPPRAIPLLFGFLLQVRNALFRLVKFGVPKDGVQRAFNSELARLLLHLRAGWQRPRCPPRKWREANPSTRHTIRTAVPPVLYEPYP